MMQNCLQQHSLADSDCVLLWMIGGTSTRDSRRSWWSDGQQIKGCVGRRAVSPIRRRRLCLFDGIHHELWSMSLYQVVCSSSRARRRCTNGNNVAGGRVFASHADKSGTRRARCGMIWQKSEAKYIKRGTTTTSRLQLPWYGTSCYEMSTIWPVTFCRCSNIDGPLAHEAVSPKTVQTPTTVFPFR